MRGCVHTTKRRNEAIITLVGGIYKKVKKKYPTSWCLLRRSFIAALKRKGFKKHSAGGYKETFRNQKDFPEFIVKVYLQDYGHTEDTNYQELEPIFRRKYLKHIFLNELFLIQPFANGDRGCHPEDAYPHEILFDVWSSSDCDRARDRDIREENVLFHNGEPYIIDFCC